jgi:hypothetical protein
MYYRASLDWTTENLTPGHCTTIIGTVLLTIGFLTFQSHATWVIYLYRVTLAATAITYGLSVRQKLKGGRPTIYGLLPLDSFQFGALACVWLFTHRNFVKLIPFMFVSILQAADFASTKLGMHDTVQPMLDKGAYQVEDLIAHINVIMFGPLIVDVLLLRTGSFVSLLAYLFFYRLRLAFSLLTQTTVDNIMNGIDSRVEKMPPRVQEMWKKAKRAVNSYEGIDLESYAPHRDADVTTTNGSHVTSHPNSKKSALDKDHFLLDDTEK